MFSAAHRSFLWMLVSLVTSIAGGVLVAQNAAALASAMTLPSFLAIPLEYQAESPIIFTLMGVVCGLLFFFMLAYMLQGLRDGLRLNRVKSSLQEAANQGRFSNHDQRPETLQWSYYPLFSQLWRDFAETLHPSKAAASSKIGFRATLPAEMVFSHQVLVDIPMRVEFFRHLPGILTGAGIVSTFAGILLGLSEFNPTVAPDQVTHQLKNLFTGVSTAFVASFFAIFTAIVVTALEKLTLSLRYSQVTQLQRMLDEFFKGGVESEYLAQIAENGERNFIQLEQMSARINSAQGAPDPGKSIGEGFAQMGRTLSDAMSSANQELARRLGEQMAAERLALVRELGEGLRSVLHEPLAKLAHALEAQSNQPPLDLQGLLAPQEQLLAASTGLRDDLLTMRAALEQAAQAITNRLETSSSRMNDDLTRIVGQIEALSQGVREESTRVTELLGKQNDTGQNANQHLAKLVAQGTDLDSELSRQSGQLQAIDRGIGAVNGGISDVASSLSDISSSLSEITLGVTEVNSGIGEVNIGISEVNNGVSAMGSALERQDAQLQAMGAGMSQVAERIAQAHKESASERDAFLLARLNASQGALTEHMTTTLEQSVRQPVERLAASLEAARNEQEEQGQQLTKSLLEAFAASLRETVTGLSSKLEELAQIVRNERKAMEDSLLGLIDALADASREGGEQLAGQLEKALSGSEVRQNAILETLSRFTAGMKVDLNILQERIEKTTREISDELIEQSKGISVESGASLLRGIEQSAHLVTGELRQTLESLARIETDRDQARDAALRDHVEQSGSTWAAKLEEVFRSGVDTSVQTVTSALTNASAAQQQQTRDVANMLLTVLASKLEENFKGISGGLEELQQRLASERQDIKSAMQSWISELGKSSNAEARNLSERIREVMEQAESRHTGLVNAFDTFGKTLNDDLSRMHDGLLQNNQEMTKELSAHVDNVVNSIGKEQSTFIEMLGERMETMRRQLRVNVK